MNLLQRRALQWVLWLPLPPTMGAMKPPPAPGPWAKVGSALVCTGLHWWANPCLRGLSGGLGQCVYEYLLLGGNAFLYKAATSDYDSWL
jgi:hypothetical protein